MNEGVAEFVNFRVVFKWEFQWISKIVVGNQRECGN